MVFLQIFQVSKALFQLFELNLTAFDTFIHQQLFKTHIQHSMIFLIPFIQHNYFVFYVLGRMGWPWKGPVWSDWESVYCKLCSSSLPAAGGAVGGGLIGCWRFPEKFGIELLSGVPKSCMKLLSSEAGICLVVLEIKPWAWAWLKPKPTDPLCPYGIV